jgi:xylulokinase
VSHILTFDLGTTYFKVCLFDETGQLVAVRRAAPPITHTKDDRCELSVEGFRNVLTEAVLALGRSVNGGLSDVAAISFATQANSFVLLDEHDQPLTPFIMWPDNRACPTEPLIDELSNMDGFYHTTGIPAMSGQFLSAKLLWLQKHEPKLWSQTKRVCLISDYLTLWMTGQHVTEAGTAGLTGLVDIHQIQWWPEACRHLSIPDSWLPKVVRAGTGIGCIRQDIAESMGLPPDCRFIVGCLDQFAGAIGAGNVTPGGVSETTGTVLATVRCADHFDPDVSAGIFQGPGPDEHTWYQMVFGDTSANLLEAYRNSLTDGPTYDSLCDLASKVPRGCDGLCIDASKTHQPDRMFLNQTEQHTPGHRVRAILEAVAFALDEQLHTLCGNNRPPHIRSVGGAARSDLWLQIKADVLDLSVQATTCTEPTSLGAAILAASSLKETKIKTLAEHWILPKLASQPNPAAHQIYARLLSSE